MENKAPLVSSHAAAAYGSCRTDLTTEVNRILFERSDLAQLIGSAPLRMMTDNHDHHGRFMADWLQLGQTDMLLKTMQWAVDSYCNHGFTPKYFPVELQAWIEVISDQIEEPAATELVAVYNWMLQQLERLSPDASRQLADAAAWTDEQEQLLKYLLEGAHRPTLAWMLKLADSPDRLRYIYVDLIQPVLYRIGLLWQQGRISVAHEHLATSIVIRIMAALYEKIVTKRHDKGKLIMAAAAQEPHEIGARMIADLLELDGWQVLYMGANTPGDDLITMLAAEKPLILGLSVTLPFNLMQMRETVKQIRADSRLAGLRILAGGAAIHAIGMEQQQTLFAQIDAMPRRVDELLSTVNGWRIA